MGPTPSIFIPQHILVLEAKICLRSWLIFLREKVLKFVHIKSNFMVAKIHCKTIHQASFDHEKIYQKPFFPTRRDIVFVCGMRLDQARQPQLVPDLCALAATMGS